MRMRVIVATFFSVVLLSGCSTVSGWFSSNKQHEPTQLREIQLQQPLVQRWSQDIGDTSEGGFVPRYLSGNVYAANSDGQVKVLDALSGRSVGGWSLKKTDLSTGIAVSESTVYVASNNGELLALDRNNGNLRWKQSLTSLLLEAPLLMENGVIVVRTNDGRITGFDANDGRQLWTNAHSMPQLLVRNTGSMTPVDGNVLLVGLPAGRMQAVHSAKGDALWEAVVANPRGATELERATDIVSHPLYDNGQICAVAFQGRVACFDIRSGNQQWAYDMSSSKGLAVNGSSLFVTADDDSVLAFDRNSGQRLWKLEDLLYRGVSAPVLLGNDVLVIDAEGYAHLISASTGALIGRLKLGIGPLTSPPQTFGTSALLQSDKRLIYISLGN